MQLYLNIHVCCIQSPGPTPRQVFHVLPSKRRSHLKTNNWYPFPPSVNTTLIQEFTLVPLWWAFAGVQYFFTTDDHSVRKKFSSTPRLHNKSRHSINETYVLHILQTFFWFSWHYYKVGILIPVLQMRMLVKLPLKWSSALTVTEPRLGLRSVITTQQVFFCVSTM